MEFPLLLKVTYTGCFFRSFLVHYRLFRLEKLVGCWAYTEPGPPTAIGGTGL